MFGQFLWYTYNAQLKRSPSWFLFQSAPIHSVSHSPLSGGSFTCYEYKWTKANDTTTKKNVFSLGWINIFTIEFKYDVHNVLYFENIFLDESKRRKENPIIPIQTYQLKCPQ